MKTYVYALADPRDGLYRYIGGAYGNSNRVNEHAHGSSRAAKSLRPWLAELSAEQLSPVRRILFTCGGTEEVSWAEPATWKTYAAKGHPLLNECPGVWSEATRSAEARAKISAARTGRRFTHTDEARAKISAAGRGRLFSAEVRAKISAALKGVPKSAEHCANASAAKKGKPLTPAQAAARVGRRSSLEQRAKQSAALKGKPWTEARRRAGGL